jgi:hypothetical protein
MKLQEHSNKSEEKTVVKTKECMMRESEEGLN